MTQEQIARAVGCSQSSVSDLCRGHVLNPAYPVGAALIALYRDAVQGVNGGANGV